MSGDLLFGYDYDVCSPDAPCEACKRHTRPVSPDPRGARIEAENARLEALIVEQGASSFVTDEMYAEAAAIRSRGPGVECPTRGKKE